MVDKTHAFSLSWDDGLMRLYYGGTDNNDCYSLTLVAQGRHDIRFTSDDGVAVDTRRGLVRNGVRIVDIPAVCSKWGQIYLTR